MSLSECPKCYGSPCECGHDYKHVPMNYLIRMRDLFQRLINERKQKEKNNEEAKRIETPPNTEDPVREV